MILPKHSCFQNIKVKLNSRILMTLKTSVVIFPTLEPQRPQWPLQPQQPQRPQWPQQPHFINFFIQPNGWIIPSTQITNTSPFFWNGSSKIQFFTHIWVWTQFELGKVPETQSGTWGNLVPHMCKSQQTTSVKKLKFIHTFIHSYIHLFDQ